MGSMEDGTPTKSSKPASSSTQEASSTPTVPAYPDWPSSMQALYGPAATPPFFAPPVGSPSPHPFLWGGQHPLMPPYGMPVYPAMYPPGGVYAHPNMVMTPGNVNGTSELDVKSNDENDRSSSKKTKGTSGNNGLVGIKTGDGEKAASGSGHEEGTQSGESGSEGSSDASDDNNQDFSKTKKGSFELMLADGANAQNNSAPSNLQPSAAKNSAASVPPAHLNMGMDLWNASSAGSGPMRLSPNQYASPHVAPPGMDERELKRQKRKQSNRESARRSRLRKQAECEDLQHRVEILSNENLTLRDELRRLSEECENLTSENNSIKEELVRLYGPEAMAKLEDNNSDAQDRDEDDN